jgi:hypothetical protein
MRDGKNLGASMHEAVAGTSVNVLRWTNGVSVNSVFLPQLPASLRASRIAKASRPGTSIDRISGDNADKSAVGSDLIRQDYLSDPVKPGGA